MKKQIHPFPHVEILINTKGSTYNDSLYPINMWKPLDPSFKVEEKTQGRDQRSSTPWSSNSIFINNELKINQDNLLCFFLKKEHKKKLQSLFPALKRPKVSGERKQTCELLCEYAKYKIVTKHKTHLLNYSNLSLFTVNKIRCLDIDIFTNPLWNGKVDSRFGIFEQVSDNALFKFKKRFGGASF